jgi:hypothetical protein
MGKKRRVLNVTTGEVYDSVSEAARAVGVGYRQILNVLDGYCKHCRGYEWRDADGERE